MYVNVYVMLLLNTVAFGAKFGSDYEDDIQNSLLEDSLSNEDLKGEQPIFAKGLWQCGNCDVIDPNKLIYTETNDVETNYILDDVIAVVQVGLALDDMQCITVSADADSPVRRVWGHCAGAGVTLAVHSTQTFVINVYGK